MPRVILAPEIGGKGSAARYPILHYEGGREGLHLNYLLQRQTKDTLRRRYGQGRRPGSCPETTSFLIFCKNRGRSRPQRNCTRRGGTVWAAVWRVRESLYVSCCFRLLQHNVCRAAYEASAILRKIRVLPKNWK